MIENLENFIKPLNLDSYQKGGCRLDFNPNHIFVFDKIKKEGYTKEILSNFDSNNIEFVRDQKPSTIIKRIEKKFDFNKKTININAEFVNISKRILMLGTTNQFVERFVNNQECYCPSFYSVIPMSNGCPYNCQYCFLQMTYRKLFPYIKINVNLEHMENQIRKIAINEAKKCKHKILTFNCGEKMDSLACDKFTGITTKLLNFFAESPDLINSKLLFLSKSDYADNLLRLVEENPRVKEKAILSWSINAEEFAKQYELGSPSPIKRLEAAKKCQDAGYKIRLRIDPIIYKENWRSYYSNIIKKIFRIYNLTPDVITLGSLRFNDGLDSLSKARFKKSDLFSQCFIKQGFDKNRYSPEIRIEMYKYIIDQIVCNSGDLKFDIALCKEKDFIWESLGLKKKLCNCIAKNEFSKD